RRAPLRLPLVPRNGCGRPGRAPERFLPLDITSLLLHVIFDARFLLRRSEERFSRNAETDLVCRLLLEKKKKKYRSRQEVGVTRSAASGIDSARSVRRAAVAAGCG